jgi:hypothetical protein
VLLALAAEGAFGRDGLLLGKPAMRAHSSHLLAMFANVFGHDLNGIHHGTHQRAVNTSHTHGSIAQGVLSGNGKSHIADTAARCAKGIAD